MGPGEQGSKQGKQHLNLCVMPEKGGEEAKCERSCLVALIYCEM